MSPPGFVCGVVCHFLRYMEGCLLCFLLFLAGEKGYGEGYKRDIEISFPLGEGTSPITLRRRCDQGSQWNLVLSSGGGSWSVTLKRAKNSFQPGSLFP